MIRLGPAGSGGLGYIEGLKYINKFKLNAMEVEFTYGVRMSNEIAKKVGKLAKELSISLSVHAPYYINLLSSEKKKIEASKKRILESCERAYYLNASCVVFHVGFYGKLSHEESYSKAVEEVSNLQKKVKVSLAPETTGKRTQFGSVDELLKLKKETGCDVCIDFAHIKAREQGINYEKLFDKIKLKHIHSHFSGIEYTEKGEKRHLVTKEEDIKELLQHIIKRKLDITIINESPEPIEDSIKTKKLLTKLL